MSEMTADEIKFVPKGWGYERWIVNKEEYCGKELFIAKDRKLSLHYHKLKDETFWVLSGDVMLIYYDEPYLPDLLIDDSKDFGQIYALMSKGHTIKHTILWTGDSIHIPARRRHALVARKDTRIIEFSTQHFDEDSYRILKGDQL